MCAFTFKSHFKKYTATLNEIVGHYLKCDAVSKSGNSRSAEPGKKSQPLNGVVRQGVSVKKSESDDSDSGSEDDPPPKTSQQANLPPKKQKQQMKSPPKPPGKKIFILSVGAFEKI